MRVVRQRVAEAPSPWQSRRIVGGGLIWKSRTQERLRHIPDFLSSKFNSGHCRIVATNDLTSQSTHRPPRGRPDKTPMPVPGVIIYPQI
jgi:hypothetical protein